MAASESVVTIGLEARAQGSEIARRPSTRYVVSLEKEFAISYS